MANLSGIARVFLFVGLVLGFLGGAFGLTAFILVAVDSRGSPRVAARTLIGEKPLPPLPVTERSVTSPAQLPQTTPLSKWSFDLSREKM